MSSIQPADSISMNSRQTLTGTLPANWAEVQTKSKYNTLTPAEAKKLNRFLRNGRQPIRTASVLHKPRPPPIVVTDLDGADEVDAKSLPINGAANNYSTSVCGVNYRDRRHSINYGRPNSLNGRLYVVPTSASSSSSCNKHSNNHQPTSPNDSESNLSYRSSIEIADSVYGSMRLQTMSVDLGNPKNLSQIYDNVRDLNNVRSSQMTINDYQNNKLSDDSFTSARSEISMDMDRSSNKSRSTSKASLSSSTYKVFQGPFANFKRFFRNMPRPFTSTTELKHQINNNHISNHYEKSSEESMSRVCLDRSQSPPVCPPPPGELKSVSYMESAVNYSNYDEFTRARNERLNVGHARYNDKYATVTKQQAAFDGFSTVSRTCDRDDSDSWQLTSLPVSYERNLTTVFEEKQSSPSDSPRGNMKEELEVAEYAQSEIINHLIKPPVKFDDDGKSQRCGNDVANNNHPPRTSATNSSQSLASTTTVDSVLDYHRQTATAYRFSFAQTVPPTNQVSFRS